MRTWHWAVARHCRMLTAMKTKHVLFTAGAALLAGAAWWVAAPATLAAAPADHAAEARLVARGRHLVENVALCADCHSPRLPTGEFDRTRWLMGAPIGFKPLVEMPWVPVAPPLGGLPGYTDEQAVRLLTTGQSATGRPILPPMPGFRLAEDEARAVVAYLRSLAPLR